MDGTLQENLHGWFDGGLEPRVVVEPGDRVVFRMPDAMWDRDAPDSRTDRPRLARPEGPGDALTVRVLEILTRDWAVAGYAPGKGAP